MGQAWILDLASSECILTVGTLSQQQRQRRQQQTNKQTKKKGESVCDRPTNMDQRSGQDVQGHHDGSSVGDQWQMA